MCVFFRFQMSSTLFTCAKDLHETATNKVKSFFYKKENKKAFQCHMEEHTWHLRCDPLYWQRQIFLNICQNNLWFDECTADSKGELCLSKGWHETRGHKEADEGESSLSSALIGNIPPCSLWILSLRHDLRMETRPQGWSLLYPLKYVCLCVTQAPPPEIKFTHYLTFVSSPLSTSAKI